MSSIHSLYRFLQNISQAFIDNYMNKLGCLYNREFAIALVVDWAWLRRVGMVTEVERHCTKLFVREGFFRFHVTGGGIFSLFKNPFIRNY